MPMTPSVQAVRSRPSMIHYGMMILLLLALASSLSLPSLRNILSATYPQARADTYAFFFSITCPVTLPWASPLAISPAE